ncbi:MAG: hypothetical protein KDE32_15440 [Novosphingobium sp.]|nr:hypothetical protein [Novosphingobium sp.]
MPSAAEQLVRVERANRDAARATLDTEIARIRGDIEQRGIGGRIADEASAKALAALDDASQIASESKGVIGGTIALLVLWFFRKPILSALASLFDSGDDNEGNEEDGNW